MKLDKDTVIKHHFWFLLGAAMPLALLAIFILMTVVSAEISKNRTDLTKKYSDLKKNANDVKNKKWVDEMDAKVKEMEAKQNVVWQKAYEEQKDLYTWPESIESTFNFNDGLFATEISAERGKAKGGQTAADGSNRFHGVVIEKDPNYIKVKGQVKVKVKDKEVTREETKTFFRTAKIKVSMEGEKGFNFFKFKPDDRVTVTFVHSKYFDDPLTFEEREEYEKASGYHSQIDGILAQVFPVNTKGEGIVQLGNWTYREGELPPFGAKFFHYVKGWDTSKDFSSEAWLAQEELWLQREIYRLIRIANKDVSVFKGTGGEEKNKTYSFTNPYWKLDLSIAGPKNKKLKATIQNLLPRRQKLDLYFWVKLQKDPAKPLEKIKIEGEPLFPQASLEVDIDIKGLAATGLYGVEQVINWETAAVKRLDQISFASDKCHSNRTMAGLSRFKEVKKAGGDPSGALNAPAGDGGMPKMDDMSKGPGKGGKGGGGKSPNGLSLERYSEKTDQARRMPVGIAMIVDQEHIDRVLLAFAQSRLRFLTTQVIMNRYPQSVRPSLAKQQSGGDGDGDKKGFPGGFSKQGGGFAMPGQAGGDGRSSTSPAAAAGDVQESNVELVIYGIVSLYARFPPPHKSGP